MQYSLDFQPDVLDRQPLRGLAGHHCLERPDELRQVYGVAVDLTATTPRASTMVACVMWSNPLGVAV